MKKILFIFSLTTINVYAVNCLDMIQATLYNSANKYHLDSAYIENYGSDFSYYASMKYHYTENNLDSIVHCTNEFPKGKALRKSFSQERINNLILINME